MPQISFKEKKKNKKEIERDIVSSISFAMIIRDALETKVFSGRIPPVKHPLPGGYELDGTK